jgi:protease-4
MQDKSAAAVVVHVDSGGGSADASEAMTSALLELAKDRPVVVYMNSVAGLAAITSARRRAGSSRSRGLLPAHWRAGRKTVTHPLWARLHVNRVELTRGANAGFLSDSAPFTESQRAQVSRSIDRIYRQFLGHVSRSRKMEVEAVDAVGGGRVWTGQQAILHGLVDELGDLQAALEKARELANLPDDAPVRLVTGKGKPLAPQLAEQTNPAAALRYYAENLEAVAGGAAQALMPIMIDPV